MAQKEIDVVVGYDKDFLGVLVSQKLQCEFIPFRNNYYPDGSPSPVVSADYKNIEGKRVLTVWRTNQRPERDVVCRHLVNYPRLVGSLTDPETFNAKSVDVYHPYCLLGRQDHNPRLDKNPDVRDRDSGKDIGYKYEIRCFKANGARRLLTFHPHYHREPGIIRIEELDVICLDAVPYIAQNARERGIINDSTIIGSPDYKAGYNIAESLAKNLGVKFFHLDKVRKTALKTERCSKLCVNGNHVLVVDDIGSSLETLEGAIHSIENNKGIDIRLVHGVFIEDGLSRAQRLVRTGAVKSIFATDTICSNYSTISVVDEITKFYMGSSQSITH